MKKTHTLLAILFFGFLTSCKNNNPADEMPNDAIDSTAIQHNEEMKDTVAPASDTVTTIVDSSDAKSNVKLPNKMSATATVIPGEKGKYPLAETKWKLTELNGKAIDAAKKDYYINFDSKTGTFKAFVGCNKMSGKYFMKSAKNLGFSDVISTRMACENMDIERGFYNNLQKVDNYMISGKVLHLHIGKTAVAKFEAIR